jgi:KEOPS complex subunit Cgi121
MIKIIGAKGNIQNVDGFLKKVSQFVEKNDILIQIFDAELIFGKNHLISAYEHAKRAMDRKSNTTNSIEMETLLYSSGERQLKLAIPKMGVKKGNVSIALIFISRSQSKFSDKLVSKFLAELSLKREDKDLEGNEDKLKKFGISKNEMKTVSREKYGDLILEKVAMVDIIK